MLSLRKNCPLVSLFFGVKPERFSPAKRSAEKETTPALKRGGLLLAFLLLLSTFVWGQTQRQTAVGDWTPYVSHQNTRGVVLRKGIFYTITSSGLLTYNTQTETYREYTRLDGLTGREPLAICYDSLTDYIAIGYADGKLDFFRELSQIQTVQDIFMSDNIFDKKISFISSANGFFYLSTSFGVVVFDIEKKEIRYTYAKIGDNEANRPVFQTAVFGGRVYVASGDKGLYSASLSAQNLQDGASWSTEQTRGLPAGATRWVAGNDKNLFSHVNDTLYLFDSLAQIWLPVQYPEGSNIPTGGFRFMTTNRLGLYFIINNGIYFYDGQQQFLVKNYNNSPVGFAESEDLYWRCVADPITAMTIYRNNGYYFNSSNGLPNNKCQNIEVGNGKLFVAPAFMFDANGLFYLPRYGEKWQVFNKDNYLKDNRVSKDFGSILYDKTENTLYASGWSQGLVVLKDTLATAYYDSLNGCLRGLKTTAAGKQEDIRVYDMAKDAKGNIWLATALNDRPIAVITPEGKCFSYITPVTGANLYTRVLIDPNGYKWFIINGYGILVYDDRGTLETSADDRFRLLKKGTGVGNVENPATTLTLDKESAVWVGTSQGVLVWYNTYGILGNNGPIDGVCPVFNQRCLLKDETITAIAVDAANRKWIGTQNSGVYLISPDGTQQILQFNENNSPLLANKIDDIAIDETTGEVFFATSAGVISYMADASTAKENYDELFVFPNPVYTDYTGTITIRGTVSASVVRIVTAAGLLVRELTSNGGQVSWDGRDAAGARVYSGIYLALFSDPEGKRAGVAKIAVVDR